MGYSSFQIKRKHERMYYDLNLKNNNNNIDNLYPQQT